MKRIMASIALGTLAVAGMETLTDKDSRLFQSVSNGRTPLFVAVLNSLWHGDEIVTLLIENGAEVNTLDNNCDTSINWAPNSIIANILRAAGATN